MIEKTRICTKCGEEIECGMNATLEHIETCTNDAPNENIEVYRKAVELQRKIDNDPHRISFNKVFNMMNDDEVIKYSILIGSGIRDGNIIYMGENQLEKVRNFENQMIEKYLNVTISYEGTLKGTKFEAGEINYKEDKDYPDPEEVKDRREQNKLRSRFHR